MAEERPEKQAVRGIWLAEVEERDSAEVSGSVPLYLTLPGARGGDIAAMIDRGLVPLEENGAISDPEQMRIVAVEQSPSAVVELQGRFPGLKVIEQPLSSLLRNTGPFRFPEGKDERFCRAQVVNMDLDESLRAVIEQGQLTFPALALVRKFALLHGKERQVDWTLCLTLDARIQGWNSAIELLGDVLHEVVAGDPDRARIRNRSADEQQRILMVLVPKKIAHDIHRDGWHVATVENLRYGGSEGHARMVTWVIRFTWDERSTSEPQSIYREALELALSRRGSIDVRGRVSRN